MNFDLVLSQLPPDICIDDAIIDTVAHEIYDLRLLSYAQFALDVVQEYDLPLPGNERLYCVLKAALDARYTFTQAVAHPRTADDLDDLLRHLLLFALRPACELEVM
jgi:hypothetical protein